MTKSKISGVRIVGSGLIGTSMALSLAKMGIKVELDDLDGQTLALATSLLGQIEKVSQPTFVVIATPLSAIFPVLKREFEINPGAIFIDIGGVKSDLIDKVEEFPEIARRFCATHPMAGREFSGPASAQADLFEGRAWLLVPTTQTEAQIINEVNSFLSLFEATVYRMAANSHDLAIAGISHLPQIVSTTLAASLSDLPDEALLLAGQGLRDVSRLAASSGELWAPLLLANSEFLIPILEIFRDHLDTMVKSLSLQNDKSIKELFATANAERARIPGKHGSKARNYTYVPIVIDDRPGQLAAIFDECAKVEVNVEDLTIEHSPGQATGLITLALSEADAHILHNHLLDKGWLSHAPRK